MTPDLAGLARSLARPLMRQQLSAGQAYAAIVNALVQAERSGTLEGEADLACQIDLWGRILGQCLREEETRRSDTRGAIVRSIQPLIASRRPSNEILAAAHDANGTAGFPFTDREVEEIATTELFWMLRRSNRHAR